MKKLLCFAIISSFICGVAFAQDIIEIDDKKKKHHHRKNNNSNSADFVEGIDDDDFYVMGLSQIKIFVEFFAILIFFKRTYIFRTLTFEKN